MFLESDEDRVQYLIQDVVGMQAGEGDRMTCEINYRCYLNSREELERSVDSEGQEWFCY